MSNDTPGGGARLRSCAYLFTTLSARRAHRPCPRSFIEKQHPAVAIPGMLNDIRRRVGETERSFAIRLHQFPARHVSHLKCVWTWTRLAVCRIDHSSRRCQRFGPRSTSSAHRSARMPRPAHFSPSASWRSSDSMPCCPVFRHRSSLTGVSPVELTVLPSHSRARPLRFIDPRHKSRL